MTIYKPQKAKRPPETQEQKDLIASMREAGQSFGQIAKAVDMHPNAVSWHCLIMGAEPPNQNPLKPVPDQQVSISRGRHILRRFTVAEDERMLLLESTGLNYSDIARALGRRRNSIVGRLATLARRDERRELCR